MKKKRGTTYFFNFASLICFIVALCLIVLLRVFDRPEFLMWYGKYTDTLNHYEQDLLRYGSSIVSVVLLLLNFTLKAYIPWFPVSCICVAVSTLFRWYHAIAINMIGMSILYMLRFRRGRKRGAGNTERILEKYSKAHDFIDNNESGSGAVLFVLRAIPIMPINTVSTLYGTTNIHPIAYLLISLAGSSYKIISYTIIGRGVFDPASAGFIVPIILLFMFSGFVLLILSGAISIRTRITVLKPFYKGKEE